MFDKKFIKDSFYLSFFYSILKIKKEKCFEGENENILNLDDNVKEKYNDILNKNNNKYLTENLI